MSEFLSCAEYESVAASLKFPTQCFVDGKFVSALSGKTFGSVNPATGQKIADIASFGAEDIDLVVTAARKAFERGDWSRMHPAERKKIILRFVEIVEKNKVELAVLESIDSGKPVSEILSGDLAEFVDTISWHVELADKQFGLVTPSGEGKLGMIVHEPIGVVACVLPWNFPLIMVCWKLGPALSEGNSVIVKPASVTSLSALKLAEYAAEAGIPDGVFNVVTGPGSLIGEALGRHPDIDVLSFTGSTDVGRLFLKWSSESNLKNICLELGGKSPYVVLDDVKDIRRAAARAVPAIFWNMGQNCAGNSRIIIPARRKDEFIEGMRKELEANWTIGNPLDPAVNYGSIVSKSQFDTVMGYIRKGKEEGARAVIGGDSLDIQSGLFISPTVFDNCKPEYTIVREEIFGPVAVILEADSAEEAIRLANDTDYGLHSTLCTDDLTKAHTYARRINAGTVAINAYSEGDVTTPFGGRKLSGFGGHDKGRESHEQYTAMKTIFVTLD